MKRTILAAALVFLSSTGHAAGLIRVVCSSQNANMSLIHFGMIHTVQYTKVAFADDPSHTPSLGPVLQGNDVYFDDSTEEYGFKRYYLKGLFDSPHGPSHPTPTLEVYVRVFGGHFALSQTGTCQVF